MPLDIIKQTNRTMLFDVVNPKLPDLFTLLSGTDEGARNLTDAQMEHNVNTQLIADNFKSFIDIFKPTIYSYFDGYGMVYTLDDPGPSVPSSLVSKIELNASNKFLKMFSNLMDTKSTSNQINIEFDYEELARELAPASTLDSIKRLQKKIAQFEKENASHEMDSPLKKQATENLYKAIEETEQYYKEIPAILELMLGMIDADLKNTAQAGRATGSGPEARPGMLMLDAEGKMTSVQYDKEGYQILAGKKAVAELEASFKKSETVRSEKVLALKAAEDEANIAGEAFNAAQENGDSQAVLDQKNKEWKAKERVLNSAKKAVADAEREYGRIYDIKKKKQSELVENQQTYEALHPGSELGKIALIAAPEDANAAESPEAPEAAEAPESEPGGALVEAGNKDAQAVAEYSGYNFPIAGDQIEGAYLNGNGEYMVGNEVKGKMVTVLVPSKDNVLVYEEKGIIKLNKEGYRELSVVKVRDKFNKRMTELCEKNGQEYDPSKPTLDKELVVSAFTNEASEMFQAMSTDDKIDMYNQYLSMLTNWQEGFIHVAKPLIEKILGVKAFFDQYRPEGRGIKPSLVVVNAPMQEIVKPENLNLLKKYLTKVNTTNNFFDNTIWFGIVPSIKFSAGGGSSDLSEQDYRDFGYYGDIGTAVKPEPTSMPVLQKLLGFLNKENFKIQVFFSYETSDETTFSAFSTANVQNFIDVAEPLEGQDYSRFAIPCMPNFTVIPPEAKVELGARVRKNDKGAVEFSTEKEEAMKFWMNGIYIDAAFVAAGLVAAYQCPAFLNTFFKNKANMKFPGVRFDLEYADNAASTPTTMAKEITGYTEELRKTLGSKGFGFIFSSDNIYTKDGAVTNITVSQARCMNEARSDGRSVFEKIFVTTTASYIERILFAKSSGFKKSEVEKAFGPGGIIKEWGASSTAVNTILGEGDSIEKTDSPFDSNACDVTIKFGGETANLNLNLQAN